MLDHATSHDTHAHTHTAQPDEGGQLCEFIGGDGQPTFAYLPYKRGEGHVMTEMERLGLFKAEVGQYKARIDAENKERAKAKPPLPPLTKAEIAEKWLGFSYTLERVRSSSAELLQLAAAPIAYGRIVSEHNADIEAGGQGVIPAYSGRRMADFSPEPTQGDNGKPEKQGEFAARRERWQAKRDAAIARVIANPTYEPWIEAVMVEMWLEARKGKTASTAASGSDAEAEAPPPEPEALPEDDIG